MPREEYFDRTFDYIYTPPNGQLSADEELRDQVSLDTDADFMMAAWSVKSTDAFSVQLTDSDGYQLQNIPVSSQTMSDMGPIPQVFSPAHHFPAGGRIQLLLKDLSGAANDVQIVFRGWKRFRRPMPVQK